MLPMTGNTKTLEKINAMHPNIAEYRKDIISEFDLNTVPPGGGATDDVLNPNHTKYDDNLRVKVHDLLVYAEDLEYKLYDLEYMFDHARNLLGG